LEFYYYNISLFIRDDYKLILQFRGYLYNARIFEMCSRGNVIEIEGKENNYRLVGEN